MIKNLNKKLIVCDLDGTLLNDKSQLSQETIEKVKSFSEQGHFFCLSTGRTREQSIDLYEQLGLKTLMSCMNGAHISNPSDENFQTIVNPYSQQVFHDLMNCSMFLNLVRQVYVVNQDGAFTFAKQIDYDNQQLLFDFFHFNNDILRLNLSLEKDWKKIDKDILTIILIIEEANHHQLLKLIETMFPALTIDTYNFVLNQGWRVLNVNTFFQNKAISLQYLASYYGCDVKDVYVFGDGTNDIGMLKQPARTFAMKNAPDSIKPFAKNVTIKTNNEDGVVFQLEKELLNK